MRLFSLLAVIVLSTLLTGFSADGAQKPRPKRITLPAVPHYELPQPQLSAPGELYDWSRRSSHIYFEQESRLPNRQRQTAEDHNTNLNKEDDIMNNFSG
jgi:hypothetical protein